MFGTTTKTETKRKTLADFPELQQALTDRARINEAREEISRRMKSGRGGGETPAGRAARILRYEPMPVDPAAEQMRAEIEAHDGVLRQIDERIQHLKTEAAEEIRRSLVPQRRAIHEKMRVALEQLRGAVAEDAVLRQSLRDQGVSPEGGPFVEPPFVTTGADAIDAWLAQYQRTGFITKP